MMLNKYKYSRWDGTQGAFEPTQEELLEEMANDLMNHGDVKRALRDLFQRGMQGDFGQRMPGLREMLDRLKARRQEQLQQYNLDSVTGELKERLDLVIDTERKGIERRLEEARQQLAQSSPEEAADREQPMKLLEERASRSKDSLDNLPPSLGGAVKELGDYDFMNQEAQSQFRELMDLVKQRMLENYFQNLRQQLQSVGPKDMAGLRQMLQELNQMLRDRMQGREPDFQGFMDKYGHLFGPNPPQSLSKLMEQLQQQMAQAQSLLDSMSQEMRQELQDLMESAMDQGTMNELAQMAAAMDYLYPMDDLRREYPFMGEESLTWEKAMELMGKLQDMDELERQIQEVTRRGNVEGN